MLQELEKYKDKAKILKEEVRFFKGDRNNIIKFKICAIEVREEFQAIAKKLYTDLQGL